MNLDVLKSPELQKRLKSAKTPEELLEIAKDEGYELSDEELEGVTGGVTWCACNSKGKPCNSYNPDICRKKIGV